MTTVRFAAGDITFEWDAVKAAANRRKHGVSFEEAATAFLDPLARLMDDPEQSGGEDRFVLVGASSALRTMLVVHVERGHQLRLISARLANPTERAMIGGR